MVLLVNPGAWLLNGPPAAELVQHVHAGAGLLVVGGSKMARAWRPDSPLAALMPLQVAGPVPFVPGEVLLRLSAGGRHHPVVRPPVGADDPWLRLPPLPGYFRTAQQRPGTIVLVESVGGDPGHRGGRVWRGQSYRGPVRVFLAARPDEQRRRWPAADHSDVLARRHQMARARRPERARPRLDRATRVPGGRGSNFRGCRSSTSY